MPLLASTGASVNDINQGYLGDCHLLAGLAEVANQQPSTISAMFTKVGPGLDGRTAILLPGFSVKAEILRGEAASSTSSC